MPQNPQRWDEHGNPIPDAPKQSWDEHGNLITAAPTATPPAAKPQTERALQQGMGGAPMFVDVPKGEGKQFEAAGKAGYAKGGQMGLEMVSGAIGAEAGVGIKGAMGLGARMIGAGAGGAAGSVVGQAAGKGKVDFWDAVSTGAMFSAFEPLGEAAGAGMKRLSRLWKSDPQRLKDIGELISTEEKTRQVVQGSAPDIRKAINATYPEVQTPVRIMPAAKVAQTAEAKMVADKAPGMVGKVAGIGRERQMAALRLLSRARRVMEQSPEGIEEVREILDKAKSLQGMSFRDTQKLYSALGRAAAKGQGWKLSGEQIRALTDTRDMLESSMRDALKADSEMEKAAKAVGVMPEGNLGDHLRFRDGVTGGSFSVKTSEYSDAKLAEEAMKLRKSIPESQDLSDIARQKQADVRQRVEQWQPSNKEAQWEEAQAKHRQFIEDFYKTGGALKPIMDAEESERGVVLKHLISDPTTRVRATQALQRYGIDTKEIMRLAEKWRDPTELNRLVQDAARAEQLGESAFSKQEVSATRKKVGGYLTKGAVGLAGAEGIYQLYKALGGKSPNLIP